MRKDKGRKRPGRVRDRHVLYEAAVQSVGADLDFFERVYRTKRGRRFTHFREDFCGTAALACSWAKRRTTHRSWAVDLHRPTLEWGRRHRLAHVGEAAARVELICGDVLRVRTPRVDVVAALNFSYSVFKERKVLRDYFRRVRQALRPDGVFFVDVFGGIDTMKEARERKRIAASVDWDGMRVPSFGYVWEQASFNPVDHHIVCHIHFELPDGTTMRRAFTYDWRLWTLPELKELMLEAGFGSAEVYVEGWDEDAGDTDGVYRRRVRFENWEAWVAYVVGFR